MSKSADAFRTIREVADWLGVPTHVLRFWESKFDVVSPVKGPGGRRYYRPDDMRLLGGIRVLLHDQGMTIRGVQKMIAEDGTAPIEALTGAYLCRSSDQILLLADGTSGRQPARYQRRCKCRRHGSRRSL